MGARLILNASKVIDVLAKHYGVPELSEPRTPFALILWENCAYLVADERRARTFENLRSQIGVTPKPLIKAGVKRIAAAIADGGMQPIHRAAKVLKCAEIAAMFAEGDLDAVLPELDEKKRRALLKRFPGIAEPGADRVLLLCGFSMDPTVDSNGLRVLERLGAIPTEDAYAASYKASIAYLKAARIDALAAFELLREHGRTLCKRNNPQCPACPLRKDCAFAKGDGLTD